MKLELRTCSSRNVLARLAAASALVIAATGTFAATTGFNQTTGGPWDYNTAGNWVGNAINGTWDPSLTLAATQTVTFAADTTVSTGLNFNYAGNVGLTLDSSSATAHTMTLGGDVSLNTGGGTAANVTIGDSSNPLNVALGASRTFTVATNRTLTMANVISGTGFGLTNAGAGTLILNSANTYSGGTTINAGTIQFANGDALGTGPVTANGGTLKWSYTSGNGTFAHTVVVNGPTVFDVAAGNWTLNGSLSGSGTITRGTSAIVSLYLGGDNSGFTGTYQDQANGNAVTRITSANSGSANARWIWNQGTSGRMSLNFGNGTINWGSMTGSGFVQQTGTGTTVVQAGGLGLNDTFAGVMQEANAGTILAFTKVGSGTMTLSGASSYTGTNTVENGALVASNNVPAGANGPFGNAASPIVLGSAASISSATAMSPQLLVGGMFSMMRPVTVGVNNNSLGNASTTFTVGGNTAKNSTFAGAITLNQNLVVSQVAGGTLNIAGGISSGSSGTQTVIVGNSGPVNIGTGTVGGGPGTIALTENGPGTLTLSGAHTYTGPTLVNAGTLRLAPALLDRWSFNGSLNNSVIGSPAATFAGSGTAATQNSTSATLVGGSHNAAQYISLGSNLLPGGAFTIEVWATMNSIQNWSRVFDFGGGTTSFLMAPWTQGTGNSNYRLAWNQGTELDINGSGSYTTGQEYHFAAVITPGAGTGGQTLVQWYVGPTSGSMTLVGTLNTSYTIANLNQANLWLGHSQFSGDSEAASAYDEVRIWNTALSSSELNATHAAGPDALPSITATVSNPLASSPNINVSSSATLDVSAAAGGFTLSANQNILGNGVVTGAVTTASTSKIHAGTDSVAGTLSFSNNVTMTSGSAFNLDVGISSASGSDKVIIAGSLALNTTTFYLKALGGASNLDQSADYVLISAAGISGNPNGTVSWIGAQPANAANYTVVKSGNNVVLHYATVVLNPPTVTKATASPATLTHGARTLITAAAMPGSAPITSMMVSGSALTGTVTLLSDGAGNYTNNAIISASASVGSQALTVSALDTNSVFGSSNITVTVVATNATWNGAGVDNKWSTSGNWVFGMTAGVGDNVAFAGTAQLTNNLDASVTIGSLTFDSSAGSFDITSAANMLTLAGNVTNNSLNTQTFDVPVAFGSAGIINLAAGNVVMNKPVSDSGAGLTVVGNKTLTLSGASTYSGPTTIGSGALVVSGSGSLGGGSYSGGITDNGSLSYSSSAAQTLSGVISGTGCLTNNGTLTVSGANTFSGGLTQNSGMLKVNNASALGAGTVTFNGGTIQAGGGYAFANNLAISGAAVWDMAGNNTRWNGNLSGSAGLTLNNSGAASTLALSGNNSSYGGTITFNNNNAVDFVSASAGSANAAWMFNDGNAGRVRVDIGNGTLNFGSLAGSGQIVNNTGSSTSILSVGALGTSTLFSGTINNNGSGILALTKVGAGTLSLTGANAYTGATTVSNGTLAVTTIQTGGGAFVVNDGAVLNVSGLFGSSMAMSSLTLGAGGSSTLGLRGVGGASALINATNLVTHGTVTVNIPVVSGTGQFPLIKYNGSIGGTGYTFVLGTLPNGVTASLTNNTANHSVDVNVTANTFSSGSKHVLFIGNSFTGYNNLYLQYSNMVVSAGFPNPQVSCYWVGSSDLMSLSADPSALAMIAQGGWDYVVLQEQSSEPCLYAQDAGYMSMWMDTLNFYYDDIKSSSPNATIVLYETWAYVPDRITPDLGTNQAGMQGLISYAYHTAASNLVNSGRTNVIVAHVGDARQINNNTQNMNMYWDASHPNGPGTYTAGLVIFSTTYNADPLWVTFLEPNTANGSAVNATDGAYIRSIARYEAYLPQPNPPLYVQAATATNVPVALAWNPSPISQLFTPLGRPASYNVKRGTTNGGPYQLIGNTVGTNYTDLTASNGVTYYYVISATNSYGESPDSFETSVVPQAVPAIPANLVATAGSAQVVLAWNAANGATGYILKRSTTNGGPYAVIDVNVSGLAYTNSGLANGTVYYFVVSATNLVGESSNSIQVGARPVSPLSTNMTFNIIGGQFQFNWPQDHTGWRLEGLTNSLYDGTGWFTIPGSEATNQFSLPVAPSTTFMFLRLSYP